MKTASIRSETAPQRIGTLVLSFWKSRYPRLVVQRLETSPRPIRRSPSGKAKAARRSI
jgi:hypothetical protein